MGPINSECLERETQMLDYQAQISIPTTVTRRPLYVSTVVSYSLSYDAADVMENDNLATTFSAQIQFSIAFIGTVRKPSIEPTVLAKRLPMRKLRRLYKSKCKEGLGLCSTLCCQDDSE